MEGCTRKLSVFWTAGMEEADHIVADAGYDSEENME